MSPIKTIIDLYFLFKNDCVQGLFWVQVKLEHYFSSLWHCARIHYRSYFSHAVDIADLLIHISVPKLKEFVLSYLFIRRKHASRNTFLKSF